jgi:hypothetical protein
LCIATRFPDPKTGYLLPYYLLHPVGEIPK